MTNLAQEHAKSLRVATEAYRQTLSLHQYSTARPCTQCHATAEEGLVLSPLLQVAFRITSTPPFFCDADCAEEWLSEEAGQLLKACDRVVLTGHNWEVVRWA
jgi:hypothetical protein